VTVLGLVVTGWLAGILGCRDGEECFCLCIRLEFPIPALTWFIGPRFEVPSGVVIGPYHNCSITGGVGERTAVAVSGISLNACSDTTAGVHI